MTEESPVPESEEPTSKRSTRKEDLARAKAIRKSQTTESLQARTARSPNDHARAQHVDTTASPAQPPEGRASATLKPALWLLGSLGVLAAVLAIEVNSNHDVPTNQTPPAAASGSDPIAATVQMQPEASSAEAAGAPLATGEMAGGTEAPESTEATARHLTSALEEAMSLDRTSEDFYAAVDSSVEKLVADRVIPATPLIRADYTSYYQAVSSEFLGSSVAIFEHEYFEEYIGCCVNGGLSLILRGPATPEVQAFADRQNCALKSGNEIYLPQEVKDSFGPDESMESELTEISCKENDAYQ